MPRFMGASSVGSHLICTNLVKKNDTVHKWEWERGKKTHCQYHNKREKKLKLDQKCRRQRDKATNDCD